MENRSIKAPRTNPVVDLSNRNGILDLIASLRHGAERKKTGLFFVEGQQMVAEAISCHAPIEAIIAVPEILATHDALPVHWRDAAPLVVDVGRRRYEKAARHFVFKNGPQGIGAVIRQSWTTADRFTPPSNGLIVALNSVQDAGNVGTILRTCDAVGCSTIFILGETADPYGPVTVRASIGSVLAHTLVRTDCDGLRRLAARTGMTIVGTSPSAVRSYRDVRYKRPMMLMLGNESKGLSDEEMALCHKVVSIPMTGRRDSLNVAIAGAIVLYEALSQSAGLAGK